MGLLWGLVMWALDICIIEVTAIISYCNVARFHGLLIADVIVF
jgi:hypothetical protein